MKYERLQEMTPHLQNLQKAVDEIYNILANMIEENEIIPPEIEEKNQKIQTETEGK